MYISSSAMQILIKTSDNSNIINERNLLFFYDVYFAVMNSSVTFNGVRYNFHDVCIKMHHPVYGETCYFHRYRHSIIEHNYRSMYIYNVLAQLKCSNRDQPLSNWTQPRISCANCPSHLSADSVRKKLILYNFLESSTGMVIHLSSPLLNQCCYRCITGSEDQTL